ncbi:hypothetical protein [Virgibacillus ndiopensis]|nr:hypothetical protein [Virgibacillus ndiopensis]
MEEGLFGNNYTDPSEIENIGTDENLAKAAEITDKSITLVKNEDN